MFPEDLLAYFAAELADEVAAEPLTTPTPLPCERDIARSALQKAIRRGETSTALRAVATLLADRGASVWRALTIIALEDLGVAGIDVLARVVVAARDRQWRRLQGGDWPVAATVVRQMAESPHCQAACDLLMWATNDPARDRSRADALDGDAAQLTEVVVDEASGLINRALAALALGGGLAAGQRFGDPAAVFHTLMELECCSLVVATCEAAWRISRNPMAFMLPMLWPLWMAVDQERGADDDIPPAAEVHGVPGYAMDRFTRVGRRVLGRFVADDRGFVSLCDAAGVAPTKRLDVAGDLLFLAEGSPVASRATWSVGDTLRVPFRPLQGVLLLGECCGAGLAHMRAQAPAIDELRQQHFLPLPSA